MKIKFCGKPYNFSNSINDNKEEELPYIKGFILSIILSIVCIVTMAYGAFHIMLCGIFGWVSTDLENNHE